MTLYQQPFDTASPNGLPGFTIVTAPTGSVGLLSVGGVAQSDTTSAVHALCSVAPGSPDQGAQITLVNSLGVQGVLLRATGTGSGVTAYIGRHNGSQVAIQKLVGGTLTTLRSAPRGRTAGQVLRMTAVGSTLTLTIDGSTAATVTDAAITAAGTTGIRVAEATSIRVDTFYSGTSTEIAAAPTGALAANTPPGQVSDLRVPATTETTASLSWSPQVGATDYLPEYRPGVGAEPWTAGPPATDPATVLTGLPQNTALLFRVTARNASGPGAPSTPTPASTRLAVQRTLSVPLLVEDRLPREYMPDGYSDFATQAQLADLAPLVNGKVPAAYLPAASSGGGASVTPDPDDPTTLIYAPGPTGSAVALDPADATTLVFTL